MPRTKGAVNYKNEMLINIISEILPNGEYGWQAVSFAYHEQSKEDQARNTDDLKRHWIKTLCNGMKKPTGKPGGPKDRIHRCISIEKKILNKTHSGMLGLSSSDGEDDEEDDAPSRGGMDDDLFGEEAEIVGGGGVNESFESAQDEFDGGNTDAAVARGDLPPPPRPVVALVPPLEVQDTAGDIEVEGMSQPASSSVPASSAQVDVRRALQRAASLVKAQKTKNASNKNKERTCRGNRQATREGPTPV